MRAILLTLSLCGLTAFTGCGSDPTAELGSPLDVTGTISLDGKPSDGVEVIFQRLDAGAPAEHRQYVATTDPSGKYALNGVFPAKYSVMVNEKQDEGEDEEMVAIDIGPYKKYGVESELTAEVSESNNTIDFDLSSK